MRTLKKKIQDLKNLRDIQGEVGNWDSNDYMLGLFNGLEMGLSVFEEREPHFRTLKKCVGIKNKK